MTQGRSLYFVAAAPILMAACATGPSDQTTQTTQLPGSPHQDLAVEAQEYRAQSYTLWDMADRRPKSKTGMGLASFYLSKNGGFLWQGSRQGRGTHESRRAASGPPMS
jgi:hypothetical protein